MDEGVPGERRAPLGRRFVNLWAARGVSSLGDGLLVVALPLLAASLTHDPRLIVGVGIATQLPWLFFGLLSGAIVDRYGPRATAVVVETVRTLLLFGFAALIAFGGVKIGVVYLVAFVVGAMETGFSASLQSAIPMIVTEPQLTLANGRVYAVESAGQYFAGPLIGGVVFAAAVWLPFVLDGASFAASAILLLLAVPVLTRAGNEAVASRPSLLSDVVEGLRWLVHDRLMTMLLVLIGAFAALQALAIASLVLFGVETLHLSQTGYGVFFAVIGIGDVGGGVIAGWVKDRLGVAHLLIVAGITTGASYLVVAATSNVIVAATALTLEATAVGCGVVASLALRQSLVPAEMRGRVGNTFRSLALGSYPIGALVGGFVAHSYGLHSPFLVAGIAQLATVAALAIPFSRQVAKRSIT